MRPSAKETLSACAAELTEIAPTVQPSYKGAVVGHAAGLIGVAAEFWDEAAHNLVEENRAIRALLAQAVPLVPDAVLAERLGVAAAGLDQDIRISALDRINDELRAMLIEVHELAESLETPKARALETAIWAELRRSTERRHGAGDLYY